MTSNESHQVTVKNRHPYVGFIFSKVWLSESVNLDEIKPEDLKDWASDNKIVVTVRRIAREAAEPDGNFSLTYLIDATDGSFKPTNEDMDDEEKAKYQIKKTVDGKITTFTMDAVLDREDDDGKLYTYYVEEESASGRLLYNSYYGTIAVNEVEDEAEEETEEGTEKEEEHLVTRTPGALSAKDGGVVINQEYSGYELPATGGSGTIFYTLSGIGLIALAAYLLLRRLEQDSL